MIVDLGNAVSSAVAALMRMKAPENLPALAVDPSSPVRSVKYPPPPPLFRDSDKARAVLRIELDREAEYVFFEDIQRLNERKTFDQWRAYQAGEVVGPMIFLGVAIYFVECLPAPGWRVINPLAS